jgi:hypothetical protein
MHDATAGSAATPKQVMRCCEQLLAFMIHKGPELDVSSKLKRALEEVGRRLQAVHATRALKSASISELHGLAGHKEWHTVRVPEQAASAGCAGGIYR